MINKSYMNNSNSITNMMQQQTNMISNMNGGIGLSNGLVNFGGFGGGTLGLNSYTNTGLVNMGGWVASTKPHPHYATGAIIMKNK